MHPTSLFLRSYKSGKITGFITGVAGFLLLFKLIVLDHVAPSDELAPGIVVLASVINGVLFGYIGSKLQNYLTRKKNA